MLNVLRTATSSGTTTIASWGGIDTLTIGNPITGLQSITGTNILLTNQGFGFNLTLDNRADTIARNVTQTWLGDNTIFNGLFGGTFGYYGWAPPYPNLLMGSGADTLTIPDAYGRIRIDTGAGNDSITLGGPAAQWCDVQLLDPVVELASLSIGQAGLVELVGPTNQVLVTASLSLSGDGRLDVGDRAVIVDYSGASPIESIRAGITSGHNGGAWNGTGIRSSVAATTPGTAVGFAEATDLHTTFPASFAGQNVDDTTILLRHTLTGDANLDRNANLSDFNRLAANFGQASRRWSTGDFNYDTAANLTDFNLLAGRFGASLSPDGPASPPVEDPRDGLRDLLG